MAYADYDNMKTKLLAAIDTICLCYYYEINNNKISGNNVFKNCIENDQRIQRRYNNIFFMYIKYIK